MVSLGLIVAAVALAGTLLRRRTAVTRLWNIAGWLAVLALLAGAAVASPGTFELRKFVGLCLMPAGLVWLGLLVLARALAAGGRRGLACGALALWLAYTAAGNAWLGSVGAGWLERRFASIDPFAQGTFDAVVVLGGGVESDSAGRPTLTAAGDRVVLAARLWRAGKAATLAATGPYVTLADGRASSNAAATATIWSQLGVPTSAVVLIEGPRSTTDEVLAIKEAIPRNRWRHVGLLTSAWHLRRATRLCSRMGVEVTPLPADFFEAPSPQLRWIVPQQLGFWRVQMVTWELLGALAGR